MMPGMARRVRLGIDWTVGLSSGAPRRSSASSGTRRRSATTSTRRNRANGPATVSELTFREGRATDLEAVYALGEGAWDGSRPRAA